jgi:hypothetical protein
MPPASQAEEHLRVIRSLMEKATIYRTVSAEAAAVGGLLAVAASFTFGNPLSPAVPDSAGPSAPAFIGIWLAALILASTANVVFLAREAHRRGDSLISPGMKLGVRSLAPAFLVAGFFTAVLFRVPFFALIVPVWITCYGLGLLATRHFAPPSLMRLGWLFLAGGLLCFLDLGGGIVAATTWAGPADLGNAGAWHFVARGQRWMALTFGLLHIVYAVCTWPRRGAATIDGRG